MSLLIEDNLPVVQQGGLNTNKDVTLGASASVIGTITTRSATATPAAASAVSALAFGSAGITLTWGTGAPSQTQPKGSLYIRTDGSSTSTRLYINTDGATTWTNVTTAA